MGRSVIDHKNSFDFYTTAHNNIVENIINMTLLDHFYSFTQHQHFWEIFFSTILAILYLLYYRKFRKPHFVIKGAYDPRKKHLRKPLPPFPNGWYNALIAKKLPAEGVKAVYLNGRHIVVFRGKDKKVYALEAYCAHMGANIGIGGSVVSNNCVMCPFHGWTYDGETGQCVGKIYLMKIMTEKQ